MLLFVLFIILLGLSAIFVAVFCWLRKTGKINNDKKVSIIELVNLFAAIGGILSFLFVLSSHYIDKSERDALASTNMKTVISDFLVASENNKEAISHFLSTKTPEHNSKQIGILDYSYFISLETTQIDRLLSNGLIKNESTYKKLLSLSELVKKYNRDLQQVREINYPIFGENMMERTSLLIIIKHDSKSIQALYKSVEEELFEIKESIEADSIDFR